MKLVSLKYYLNISLENKFISILSSLKKQTNVCIGVVSNWYQSKALTIENEQQPDYINGAVKVQTDLLPLELLTILKKLELQMGRVKSSKRWSPRIIDLDILFYDALVYKSNMLTIPHPEIEKRLFVIKPLCDIEPTLIHPVLKKSVKELCLAIEISSGAIC